MDEEVANSNTARSASQTLMRQMLNTTIQNWFSRMKALALIRNICWGVNIRVMVRECKDVRKYLSNVDHPLLLKLVRECLQKTLKLIDNDYGWFLTQCPDRFGDFEYGCRCILGTLIFPGFSRLNLENIEGFAANVVIKCLPMFCDLQTLRLPRLQYSMPDVCKDRIITLKHLKEFTFLNNCTNEILSLVCRYCAKLIFLNIEGSISVTDDSVDSILLLQNLKFLSLENCSVSFASYERLLRESPSIENILWRGAKELDLSFWPEGSTNKFRFSDTGIYDASVYISVFPNLTRLRLTYPYDSIEPLDLAPLSQLKHLTTLVLKNYDFEQCNIEIVLKSLGSRLKCLGLTSVGQLDYAVVQVNCKNLDSMTLQSCETHPIKPVVNFEDAEYHFLCLEKLKICLTLTPPEINFWPNLHLYRNLNAFYSDSMGCLTDNLVNSIVMQNGFRRLKTFIAESSTLTAHSANFLIDNCHNLRLLGDLHSWSNIQTDDVSQIKRRIRTKGVRIALIVKGEKEYADDDDTNVQAEQVQAEQVQAEN